MAKERMHMSSKSGASDVRADWLSSFPTRVFRSSKRPELDRAGPLEPTHQHGGARVLIGNLKPATCFLLQMHLSSSTRK